MDEKETTVKKQLNPPQNLRCVKRHEYQIDIKWDRDSNNTQTLNDDSKRWHYVVAYTPLLENKDDAKNGARTPTHNLTKDTTTTTRNIGIKNGNMHAKLTGISPNLKYTITVAISDKLNKYVTSTKCKSLIVGKYGMCYLCCV